MNILQKFLYGNIENMEYGAFRWWNSKRMEYNLKFIGCLVLAQFLLFGAAQSLQLSADKNIYEKLSGTLIADIVIIIVINILYFLIPILETIAFKSYKPKYRKNVFALTNALNLLILVGAIVFVVILKA